VNWHDWSRVEAALNQIRAATATPSYKGAIRALFERPQPEYGAPFLQNVNDVFQSATGLRSRHDLSLVVTPMTLVSVTRSQALIVLASGGDVPFDEEVDEGVHAVWFRGSWPRSGAVEEEVFVEPH
jgi:hypothetical protein